MLDVPVQFLPFDRHWAIEEAYALDAMERMRGMDWAALATRFHAEREAKIATTKAALERIQNGFIVAAESSERRYRPYEVAGENGDIAIIRITGPLTKQETCASWMMGGTSTLRALRVVRMAARDEDIRAILLYIDSPGGQVAGTQELADEIARAAGMKTVWAYVSDMAASAGYWLASQASEIYANKTALVGSIGTYMVVSDTSRMYENAGVKVHVVRAGAHKGAGMTGTALSDAHLAEFQRNVDALNAHFLSSVAAGRGMKPERVAELADGRVHVGQAALDEGLIDGLASYDTVLGRLIALTQNNAMALDAPW